MQNKVKEEPHGWLGFFIITLVFLSPIVNAFLVFSQKSDILIYISTAAAMSLFILSGIFLHTKKPYAVTFTKTVLIVTLLSNLVNAFITKELKLTFFVYYLIWIPYLYNSKQVKEIFGSLKEKKSGHQIWPIVAIIFSLVAPEYGLVFGVIALHKISKNSRLKGFWIALSSILLSIVVFVGTFLLGYYSAASSSEPSVIPQQVSAACIAFCFVTDDSSLYRVQSTENTGEYRCRCQNMQAEWTKEKNFTVSKQVSPAYFTELNNASSNYAEGMRLHEEGVAHFDSATDSFDAGEYKITVSECVEASSGFNNATERLLQAKMFFDKSKSYAPDIYHSSYVTYKAKISELNKEMNAALLNACEDLTQAAHYYSTDYTIEGDERFSRYNEQFQIYIEKWLEYNQTLTLANKVLSDPKVVYIPSQ